ncbi:MAG: hypothetical protein AAGI23_00135 [Bacteroidota bacterium]
MEVLLSEKAVRVADILERIDAVNKMLQVHADDEFMKSQYVYQKNLFLKELVDSIGAFDISLKDIAA